MENQEYTYITVDDEESKEDALLTLNDYYAASVFYDYRAHVPVGGDFLYEIIEDPKTEGEKDTYYIVDYSYL